jgi:hypothetical protein
MLLPTNTLFGPNDDNVPVAVYSGSGETVILVATVDITVLSGSVSYFNVSEVVVLAVAANVPLNVALLLPATVYVNPVSNANGSAGIVYAT